MGFKKVLEPFQFFTNASMSGTNTITSPVINIKNLDNMAIQWSWTGNPTGILNALGSVNGITYVPFSFNDPLPVPSGSALDWLTFMNGMGLHFLQLQYVNSSGTGTLNAWISGKDVN